LEILARPGDKVEQGQPLVRIHHRHGRGLEEARHRLALAIPLQAEPLLAGPLVLERMTA
jgi:pyrimidine-nucleoside phosphorylase/thymidine phosphorylase